MEKNFNLFPLNNNCKIVILGLGYVGLPLAIEFCKSRKCLITGKQLNRVVIGFDINDNRISDLKNNFDYTEQFSQDELKKLNNIKFTSDENFLIDADVFIITVPTPIDKFNIPDLKALKEASILVGKSLSRRNSKSKPVIIYESTVFPGATEEICIPLLAKFSN